MQDGREDDMATWQRTLGAVAVVLTAGVGTGAAPTVTIHPGKAVDSVSLGAAESAAITRLSQVMQGKPSQAGKDTEYEGQTVYFAYFGQKNAENLYPLQVYSDAHRKVFIFEINAARFVTPEGVHVGSTEAQLTKAYGNALKAGKKGRLYTKYTLGGRRGTDFFVRDHQVTQILIRDY
jgi:hypothetical protein